MSRFWKTWLTVWCFGVGLFGVVLAGAAFEATSGPARALYGILGNGVVLDMNSPLRFSIALMGAVSIGWSITLAAVIAAADQLGDRGGPVWRMTLAAILIWFVVDSALSAATGFALNGVTNALLVAGFLLPVVASGVLKRPA